MARVCTTTPWDASRSLFALRMVPFCWSARLRQSASEIGRVSHVESFVGAFVVIVSARASGVPATTARASAANELNNARNVLSGESGLCLFINVGAMLHATTFARQFFA